MTTSKLYLPEQDYYDPSLVNTTITQPSLNNKQDRRTPNQEPVRQHNASHPRVAFLKNTNKDIERNTRQVKRENMKSKNFSPVKKVDYPDKEGNTRIYFQDTEDHYRRRSPRQCEYYDEYDRSSRDRDEYSSHDYYRYQSPSPSNMYRDYRGKGHRTRREERGEGER